MGVEGLRVGVEIWEAGSERRWGREGFWAVLLVGSASVIVRGGGLSVDYGFLFGTAERLLAVYRFSKREVVWYDGRDIGIDADEIHEFSKSRRSSEIKLQNKLWWIPMTTIAMDVTKEIGLGLVKQ